VTLAALLLFAQAATFENAATKAGLTHPFPNGTTKRYIIETTGSGAGIFDYDNDGFMDALVLSGEGGENRLYHNDGRGRFKQEVKIPSYGWAQGTCAGDYDNDGFTDFVITYWGSSRLYRNLRGKGFEEIDLRTGPKRYNTGCAFLDFDRDGLQDLFLANYLIFDYATTPLPGANPYCFYRNVAVNCGPRGLPFDRNILLRNMGAGKFEDVSESSGIAKPKGHYALGVLTGDFNNDGWTDIYVACDQTPSLLYINNGNGTFEEEALLRGAALDEHGKALSGMGATAADYNNDGWLDIFRTNFSDERETLYRNRGNGDFDDVTAAAGLARNTSFVGWGCGFIDFDNDGRKDLLLVNGHVFPEVDKLPGDVKYKERAILYRGIGSGKFEDVSLVSGGGIQELHSSRGAAFGDFDNDGVTDVLINNQNEAPSLLKQRLKPKGNWILLDLGLRSLGARVKVTAGGMTQEDEVRSGGSYLSQNDPRLHFGLGAATQVDRIEITWPGGARSVLEHQPVNRVQSITFPKEPSK
jgi:enediyne biosynthesis protein E4